MESFALKKVFRRGKMCHKNTINMIIINYQIYKTKNCNMHFFNAGIFCRTEESLKAIVPDIFCLCETNVKVTDNENLILKVSP